MNDSLFVFAFVAFEQTQSVILRTILSRFSKMPLGRLTDERNDLQHVPKPAEAIFRERRMSFLLYQKDQTVTKTSRFYWRSTDSYIEN